MNSLLDANARRLNRRDRIADIQHALNEGLGYSWLSQRWNISTPGAVAYARLHSPEAAEQIAENGRTHRLAGSIDMLARLQLIQLCDSYGWTRARLAGAMGITPQTLSAWVHKHAPDGISAAMADCLDDEEAA